VEKSGFGFLKIDYAPLAIPITEVPIMEAVPASPSSAKPADSVTSAEAPVGTIPWLISTSFSAGVAESILTCSDIIDYHYNFYHATFPPDSPPSDKVVTFVTDNEAYVRRKISDHIASDTPTDYNDVEQTFEYFHWIAVAQVMAQLDGLVVGFNDFSECSKQDGFVPMSTFDFLLLNLDGDLFDLTVAFPDPKTIPETKYTSAVAILETLLSPLITFPTVVPTIPLPSITHCSAIFKKAANDVFFGHTTWDTFATAYPRLVKTFTLPVLHDTGLKTFKNSFSSSPGFISSIDDYYIVNSPAPLTVIETSLSIYNKDSYGALTPICLFSFMRSTVANMLAVDAQSWTERFSLHPSGTYNNQWMVLDRSKLDESKGLFWVLEEAPGLTVAADQTEKLNKDGYWPSFNVAYYDAIRNVIGEIDSYTAAPRAKLFHELQPSVDSIETMIDVMTWNDFLHDPISKNDPCTAIMARCDLRQAPMTPGASGGIDTKVGSAKTVDESESGLRFTARLGMTYGSDGVVPFDWLALENEELARSTPHQGHPDVFKFDFAPFN
jgi:hypothetical protein